MFKYGNLNDEQIIAHDFMTKHKIFYKSDGSSKKGCFEKCAKYAVLLVRNKFEPEYIYKEKKNENNNDGKRRRNLQLLQFDPMINLRNNSPKKDKNVDGGSATHNEKDNENTTVEVSPSPSKKRLSESEMEYKVKDMMVQTVGSYFLAKPGYYIATVNEFKNVSCIPFFLCNTY